MPHLTILWGFLLDGTHFTAFDILVGLLLSGAAIKGFFSGFIKEVISLLAWVVGLYVAVHFSFYVLDQLKIYLEWEEQNLNIAAFILTFLIIVVLFKILAKVLTSLTGFLALGLINRLAGALFGLLKSALVIGIVLIFFASFNKKGDWVPSETLESSAFYHPLKNFGERILPSVVAKINEHGGFELKIPGLEEDFPTEPKDSIIRIYENED